MLYRKLFDPLYVGLRLWGLTLLPDPVRG